MFKEIYRKMINSNSLGVFLVSLFTMFSSYILCTFLQWESIFEEGIYGKATLSLINFGDFNILPFMKNAWQVTETGHYPNFESLGITAYLFPFYLFRYVVLLITGGEALAINEYLNVNILANCFYTLMGILLLYKLLKVYLTKVSMTPFVITFFSTTLFWYTFLASTTPDTFGATYGVIALFFIFNKINDEKNIYLMKNSELFFFGLIAGFGIVIRIHLTWIAILYFLLFLNYRFSWMRLTVFFSGIMLMLALKAMNDFVHFGVITLPLKVYFIGSGWSFFKESFSYSMIGPNGYLIVSPSYLLLIPGLWLMLREKNKLAQITSFLIAFNIVFYLAYNFSWVIVDEFVGRLQNDFYFLQIISLAFIHKYVVEKKSRKVSLVYFVIVISFIFWHLYVASVYLYSSTIGKQWAWQYQYWYASLSPWTVLARVSDSFHFYRFKKTIEESYLLLPAFFGLSYILTLVYRVRIGEKQKILDFFFKLGIAVYLISTIASFTKTLFQTRGLIDSRLAISNHSMTAFYDDYAEEVKKTSLFFLYKKDCAHVFKIYKVQKAVLNQMGEHFNYDPNKVSAKIVLNKYQDSNLENEELKKEFNKMISSCIFEK